MQSYLSSDIMYQQLHITPYNIVRKIFIRVQVCEKFNAPPDTI